MRILWMSNSPWTPTGYGAQTRHMLPLLKALGHDVACFPFYGLQGGNIEYEGIRYYAPHVDPYGNDAVRGHMDDFNADALLTLFDPFVCSSDVYSEIGDRWYPWTPIDSVGLPPGMEVLQHARKIIAMSKHGERQLMEAGYDLRKVFLLPHGVDCDLHRNRSEAERAKIRESMGLPPDAFVVGIVQANKGKRKALAAQIKAFADFRRLYDANDAHLYIHTEPSTVFDGFDLDRLVEDVGLKGQGVVHRTHTYAFRSGLSEQQMSQLYGMMDVLLQGTLGEGFGIPIIEAQANGVPAIVNMGSAMEELVPTRDLVLTDATPVPSHLGHGVHFYPNHDAMVDRLRFIYKMTAENVVKVRHECRHYVEQFDWSNMRERWDLFMRVVETDQAPVVFFPSDDHMEKCPPMGGVIVGPQQVEDKSLHEWLSQAPWPLMLCPPDRVPDSDNIEFFIVLDEFSHDEHELAQVLKSKPYVVVRNGLVTASAWLYRHAEFSFFTERLFYEFTAHCYPATLTEDTWNPGLLDRIDDLWAHLEAHKWPPI